ncbi:MAG: translation initiation factor SUI1-related protein [Myxococcaceae bacterium]|nr:translation initiation factor SUI1-related protein [Myxococcaceae bacterium]
MAKKGPREPTPTSGASALKHNPFAALAEKREALPEQPLPSPPPEPARAAEPAAKSRGRLVLRRETKHRGGKPVVIVRGFSQLREFDEAATELLAKELKQKLGCGGTVEHDGAEHQIVLQGDRPAKVAELLRDKGFRVDGVTS